MPSCASTLHVGKNFGMSASCQVADTSYRSMQAPVQYILYFSKIRLYVHTYLAMKKGTFSLNQCTYIIMYLYVLSIAYVYVHNLYYRLVHTCILSQRTVTYFENIITFF